MKSSANSRHPLNHGPYINAIRLPQRIVARAWGRQSPFPPNDPSDKQQPSNSREDDVLALEKALARLGPSPSTSPAPEANPAPSSSIHSDYPVWLGKSAMLPGYWDILGVHQAPLVAMMEMALEGGPPYFYVQVSRSSSFPPKPLSTPAKPNGEASDHLKSNMGEEETQEDVQTSNGSSGAFSDDEESWLHPTFDVDRPTIGTLMEVMVVDRTMGGRRLFLAVRALARVRVTSLTQALPHPRCTIEWEPDIEEVEASLHSPSGAVSWEEAKKAAAASSLIWSQRFEVAARSEELFPLSPLSTHLVDLARSFHELSPPSGPLKEVAEDAALASASSSSSPSSAGRGEEGLSQPSSPLSLEETMKAAWGLIRDIEGLQGALNPPAAGPPPPSSPSSLGLPSSLQGSAQGQAPAPVVARALRPILSPDVSRALAPLLALAHQDEAPGLSFPSSLPEGSDKEDSLWPMHRRARWLSFALAAILAEEISRGSGRQALLEASSAKERLEMALGVLETKKERLQTLVALKGLGSTSQQLERGAEKEAEDQAEEEKGGPGAGEEKSSFEAAAMFERLFASPSSPLPSPPSLLPNLKSGGKLGVPPSASSGKDGGPIDRLTLEKKRSIKRKMQERALRRAARCQQGLGAEEEGGEDEEGEEGRDKLKGEKDEQECEALWQDVKDLAAMPSIDIDDPPATA